MSSLSLRRSWEPPLYSWLQTRRNSSSSGWPWQVHQSIWWNNQDIGLLNEGETWFEWAFKQNLLREVESCGSEYDCFRRLGQYYLNLRHSPKGTGRLHLWPTHLRRFNCLPQWRNNVGNRKLQMEGCAWSVGLKKDAKDKSYWLGRRGKLNPSQQWPRSNRLICPWDHVRTERISKDWIRKRKFQIFLNCVVNYSNYRTKKS